MKQRYFRLPWSRLRLSQRRLYRLALTELQERSECLTDRRVKRLEVKHQLKEVVQCLGQS
jgi:hypothetical protein